MLSKLVHARRKSKINLLKNGFRENMTELLRIYLFTILNNYLTIISENLEMEYLL